MSTFDMYLQSNFSYYAKRYSHNTIIQCSHAEHLRPFVPTVEHAAVKKEKNIDTFLLHTSIYFNHKNNKNE